MRIPCRLGSVVSRSPQGEGVSHQQELDPSYVAMLNAIRGLLDLEVPHVECLVAPSAFSKKPPGKPCGSTESRKLLVPH